MVSLPRGVAGRDCQSIPAIDACEEAFLLERSHRCGDGLTRGADRLAEEFVRERQFDFDASRNRGAMRSGKLQQFRP